MGSDKAFVEWQGQTFLQKAIDHLSGITVDIYLSVNAEQFAQLHQQYACIQDQYSDRGSLGGILSALELIKNDLIVVAVDMPKMNTASTKELINAAKDSNTITCYQVMESIQPFPSYWPFQLLTKLEESVLNNRLSVIEFIIEQEPKLITSKEPELFQNFNAPSDMVDP